jgi:hypothetical protein
MAEAPLGLRVGRLLATIFVVFGLLDTLAFTATALSLLAAA